MTTLSELTARLRELASKATDGEWTSQRQDDDDGSIYWAIHSMKGYEWIANIYEHEGNAQHIAGCSRATITRLLDALASAQAVVDAIRDLPNQTSSNAVWKAIAAYDRVAGNGEAGS